MEFQKKDFEAQKEKLFKDDRYMNWLERFMSRCNLFYEGDEVTRYYLTEEDKQNIKNIDVLYEFIEDYAEENYFETTLKNQKSYYSIKYNGIGYRVGISLSNAKFYCEKTEATEEAIDFHFIQENRKHPHAYLIDTQFYHIADGINKLMELGMTPENIEEQLEITVQKCKENESNKKKVKTPKNN